MESAATTQSFDSQVTDTHGTLSLSLSQSLLQEDAVSYYWGKNVCLTLTMSSGLPFTEEIHLLHEQVIGLGPNLYFIFFNPHSSQKAEKYSKAGAAT